MQFKQATYDLAIGTIYERNMMIMTFMSLSNGEIENCLVDSWEIQFMCFEVLK